MKNKIGSRTVLNFHAIHVFKYLSHVDSTAMKRVLTWLSPYWVVIKSLKDWTTFIKGHQSPHCTPLDRSSCCLRWHFIIMHVTSSALLTPGLRSRRNFYIFYEEFGYILLILCLANSHTTKKTCIHIQKPGIQIAYTAFNSTRNKTVFSATIPSANCQHRIWTICSFQRTNQSEAEKDCLHWTHHFLP
jgi:hypothetical protein